MRRAALWAGLVWLAVISATLAQEPMRPPPFPHGRYRDGEIPTGQRDELEKNLNNLWQTMPLEDKVKAMRFHRALKRMNPDEQRFVQERFERFVHMTEHEREQLKANRERWRKMSPEERDRARQAYWRRRESERRWREEHPGEADPFRRWPGREFIPHRSGEEIPPPNPSPEKPNNQEKP